MVVVDLSNHSAVDADVVSGVVLLGVVGMNRVGHVGRNEEGTLDGAFEAVEGGVGGGNQELEDAVERLDHDVRPRTLC